MDPLRKKLVGVLPIHVKSREALIVHACSKRGRVLSDFWLKFEAAGFDLKKSFMPMAAYLYRNRKA